MKLIHYFVFYNSDSICDKHVSAVELHGLLLSPCFFPRAEKNDIIISYHNLLKVSILDLNNKVAIVLGHDNSSTLGVIRSLGEKNIPVYVVLIYHRYRYLKYKNKNIKPFVRYSKYTKKSFLVDNKANHIVELLNDIALNEKELTQKTIIIPTSDLAVKVLDENLNRLHDFFIYSNIAMTQGAVSRMMNKSLMIEEAKKAGLHVPHSKIYDITSLNHINDLKEFAYPCIVKPCDSVLGGKEFIKKCINSEDLFRYLDEIKEIDKLKKVVIQEYVFGNHSFMINLMGISLTNGVVYLPGFFKKLRQYNSLRRSCLEDGNCSLTFLTNETYNVSMEAIHAFIKNIGYVGLFDIEFKVVNGVPIFIEINFRIGGPSYIYTAVGINLPFIYIRDIIGDDVNNILTYINKNSIGIMEQRDFINVIDKNISLSTWFKDFFRADSRVIFNKNDLMPVFGYFLKKLR